MKIALLNHDFRVFWKGRLRYLHRFLSSQRIDLHAIELFGQGSPYSFDKYTNTEEWWRCLFPNHSSDDLSKKEIEKCLFAALDEIDPDIVIAPSIVFFAGALGLRWVKKHKKKFIMFDDAKPSHLRRNLVTQWVKNTITSEVDGLWLPSPDYDVEYANLNTPEIYMFYGYNCVDNDHYKLAVHTNKDTRTIICVARLVPIKNLDKLLKAWKIVEGKNSGYQLNIVGDGPLFQALVQLAKKLKLNHVTFSGSVDNRDLPQYFHNADAFILPSLSESWGLVVNEAMAAGLPVLLSKRVNAGGPLLKIGVTGFCFDPQITREIAEAVLSYIRLDDAQKRAMSANALALIDTMSYEVMGNELLKAISHIIGRKYRQPGILPAVLVNLWDGRYNTSRWNKL
ncbi:glycosyltransferase family 4 protein [Hufsiella ginkgonis]|uniref:Glycosyltransferase n=1 Tax=Hufsiella ginkgonis TaxID=2695274 RepID=A0A7K1Y2B8_9SPHI|nr:glycosyltransferase family 4 protein [Hufsiella ginkgonis]MXV17410.1 glycosyltransferase [Hufsiella ginkgonis]